MIEAMQFHYSKGITAVNQTQYEEHLKLYNNYVKKINEIDEELRNNGGRKEANAIYSRYRGLKKGESFAMDGVILHELYFENLGNGFAEPGQLTIHRMEDNFGSFDAWRDDFVAAGKASRGWAMLAYDQRSKALRNVSLEAHDEGNIVLSFPILVMDVYEHAYFLQYGTDKAAYIEAFMDDINWDIVNRRIFRLFE